MRPKPLAAGALAAGLLLSACGGGDDTTTAGSNEASSIAAENTDILESTEDARTTEVLSIDDGSVTTLQQAVDGDRPVLLWFWAPH